MQQQERDLVGQDEVGRCFSMPWRFARQVLVVAGVEVFDRGPRRWCVRRSDWLRVRDKLTSQLAPESAAVAS